MCVDAGQGVGEYIVNARFRCASRCTRPLWSVTHVKWHPSKMSRWRSIDSTPNAATRAVRQSAPCDTTPAIPAMEPSVMSHMGAPSGE
ncbi:hypothetical protein OH77DRAFT_771836 [Trametes cingulata]|nr:hypothetical protein OH77DRAFT_771836 [Trametes cingulata]